MRESSLLDLQQQAGARIGAAHGWRLPSSFTSVGDEYAALTEGVGLLDRSPIGRLRFHGDDALDLLDRLSTNDLAGLTVGCGAHTVLTSNKGRILDLLYVQRLDDHLLVLTSPENRQKVADHIDFFTFTEDVRVEDVTDESAMLGLVGPDAGAAIADLAGWHILEMGQYDSTTATVGGENVLIVRTDFIGLPVYDLVASSSQGRRLWGELLDGGAPFGIKPVGTEAAEIVRVEQGIPQYGVDMSEDNNPLEAGLLQYISFTKGCYIGQEVVTRLNTYKKVRKYLVRLTLDGHGRPMPEARLFSDGEDAGVLSSVVTSPRLGREIGLGYVIKRHAEPGTRLTVGSADGQQTAEVAELALTL